MKTLVWPDIHNKIHTLSRVLENIGNTFDKRIFLGDWFDSVNDGPTEAKNTALFLRNLMDDPKNIFCEGNHDSSYRYRNESTFCGGFTEVKSKVINSIISRKHWNKFQLFEYDQGWLCSHAGVCEHVFSHPIFGVTLDGISEQCSRAKNDIKANILTPVYCDGISNGGRARFGGITWLRWWDFRPIPGLNQIVGHTYVSSPEISYARKKCSLYNGEKKEWVENIKVSWNHYINFPPKKDKICSMNYNIDTCSSYFIIIEDGEVSINLTLDYL